MGDREEPGKIPAGVLAIVVHVLFFGLLVFGVNWHAEQPRAVEAELWSSLPPVPKAKRVVAAPKPVAKPAPKPLPKPAPKPIPAPVPKPVPKPKPAKADIELKQKEKKRQEEKKRKQEELKRKQEERRKRARQLKQQEEKLKQQLLHEQQAREAELLRQQQAALVQQLQAQRAAAQARALNDFRSKIKSKIQRFIILPPDIQGNPLAEFEVTLLPSGDVLSARLTHSSGNPAYDDAVERAIYKAQPLPLPPGGELFSAFRDLRLQFHPRDSE
jgi:colicin import membrane protein